MLVYPDTSGLTLARRSLGFLVPGSWFEKIQRKAPTKNQELFLIPWFKNKERPTNMMSFSNGEADLAWT
jgi:hypothetical protein